MDSSNDVRESAASSNEAWDILTTIDSSTSVSSQTLNKPESKPTAVGKGDMVYFERKHIGEGWPFGLLVVILATAYWTLTPSLERRSDTKVFALHRERTGQSAAYTVEEVSTAIEHSKLLNA